MRNATPAGKGSRSADANMRKRNFFWPSIQQELLLRAALDTGPAAREAWTTWRAVADYDALDEGTLRLIPLLQANLQRLGIDDLLVSRMCETQRVSWYWNTQLMLRLKNVLTSFTSAGIETILLKGLPLALAYYDALDLRPIGDLDLMIRHRDWTAAIGILTAAGWRTEEGDADPLRRSTHAVAFKDRTGFEIDLHLSMFHECIEPEKLEPFWRRSVPLVTRNISSQILCSADQLLHCLVHGLRANDVSPVRWVADAVTILRREPRLDWPRLLDQTQRLRLGLPVSTGLNYLALTFPGLIPNEPLTQLSRYRPGLLEHVEWFARRHEHLTGQGARVGIFFRRYEGKPLAAKLAAVPSYFADTFGTKSAMQTIFVAGQKSLKALKGFF